ncbi:hypothetical protein E2C01_037077 [Portunus trituberculatus]|uniref:Uncharacterized protein n=1 Tax=Portunus trituberculatus TaxID=210409 RepID=A0A5B7FE07_PORTR|nr:hypothetical protein [Portunus trituberculatus]
MHEGSQTPSTDQPLSVRSLSTSSSRLGREAEGLWHESDRSPVQMSYCQLLRFFEMRAAVW